MLDIDKLKQARTAIINGNIDTLKELFKEDPELLTAVTPFGSWLHVAASEGQLEIVKLLVCMGLDVNIRGGILDAFPIEEATSEGYLSIVEYLLSVGAKMDVSEPNRNPLFGAIYGGHLEIVKCLIENGIDYQVKYNGENMQNMDAIEFATERGEVEIATYLKNLK